ncbi:MAG: hypothetical protein R2705_04355 [Ilumatobacteraceae bacterium]
MGVETELQRWARDADERAVPVSNAEILARATSTDEHYEPLPTAVVLERSRGRLAMAVVGIAAAAVVALAVIAVRRPVPASDLGPTTTFGPTTTVTVPSSSATPVDGFDPRWLPESLPAGWTIEGGVASSGLPDGTDAELVTLDDGGQALVLRTPDPAEYSLLNGDLLEHSTLQRARFLVGSINRFDDPIGLPLVVSLDPGDDGRYVVAMRSGGGDTPAPEQLLALAASALDGTVSATGSWRPLDAATTAWAMLWLADPDGERAGVRISSPELPSALRELLTLALGPSVGSVTEDADIGVSGLTDVEKALSIAHSMRPAAQAWDETVNLPTANPQSTRIDLTDPDAVLGTSAARVLVYGTGPVLVAVEGPDGPGPAVELRDVASIPTDGATFPTLLPDRYLVVRVPPNTATARAELDDGTVFETEATLLPGTQIPNEVRIVAFHGPEHVSIQAVVALGATGTEIGRLGRPQA